MRKPWGHTVPDRLNVGCIIEINVSNLVVPMYFLWTQTTRNTFERRELYITE